MTPDFFVNPTNLLWMAIAVGSGLLLAWPALTRGGAQRIPVATVTQLINQKKAVLLDIRAQQDIEKAGAVANAKQVDLKALKDEAPKLLKNKAHPVVVICQNGQRAGAAVTVLKAAGYEEVYALDGGVNAWSEAGLPLKKVADKAKVAATS